MGHFSTLTFLSLSFIFSQPLKALRASAGTSQPVLSIEQIQTVFYQLPELLDLHTEFHNSLKAKLKLYSDLEPGLPMQLRHEDIDLSVGEIFIKFVSLLFLRLCSISFEPDTIGFAIGSRLLHVVHMYFLHWLCFT